MSWNSIQLFGFIVVQYSIWGSKGFSGTFFWSGWNLMMYSLGYSTNFRCNEISDLLGINGRNEIYWASRCVKHDRKNWAFVPTVATILSWRCFTSCQDFLMPQKIMRILTTTEVLRSYVGCTLKVARARVQLNDDSTKDQTNIDLVWGKKKKKAAESTPTGMYHYYCIAVHPRKLKFTKSIQKHLWNSTISAGIYTEWQVATDAVEAILYK